MSPSGAGAFWDGKGVRFEVWSEHAESVDLCLFSDPASPTESVSVGLAQTANQVWETYVASIGPGQIYGYRVRGPWDPASGHWFNHSKLLVDPAALALAGELRWDPAVHSARIGAQPPEPEPTNSAQFVPRSVVVDREFDWEGIGRPETPWEKTLIYECHVRGMTQLHPDVPEALRGTYLGLCQEAIIEHLLSMGVTAIELLPVQHFLSEHHLVANGLRNYFGYNPIGFFAPHADYSHGSPGQAVQDFKTMVRTFHQAGIEVLLDAVFNHTAEGGPQGPTLSLRGLDNRGYYRLDGSDPALYQDFSGCGNTLDFGAALAPALVLESLRYWVQEMQVDGFRLDLAPVLGRTGQDFDAASPMFGVIQDDPMLSRAKWIAEPWDLGPDGYQLGRFPAPWAEWNDRYRDGVRRFWRGDRGQANEFARRLEGSPDLFELPRRSATSSINFVTCHDGFTLEDLVSYETKRNQANGEGNRDGHDHNLSNNWGFEGPSSSDLVNRLRAQTKRNLMATLAFSSGTPMLSHGDELGRSQLGNNNAYCQDNETTWIHWDKESIQHDLLAFTKLVFTLRQRIDAAADSGLLGMKTEFLSAHAELMSPGDWRSGSQPVFGVLRSEPGREILLIVNNDRRGHLFELPTRSEVGSWTRILDTTRAGRRRIQGRAIRIAAYSLVVLESSSA